MLHPYFVTWMQNNPWQFFLTFAFWHCFSGTVLQASLGTVTHFSSTTVWQRSRGTSYHDYCFRYLKDHSSIKTSTSEINICFLLTCSHWLLFTTWQLWPGVSWHTWKLCLLNLWLCFCFELLFPHLLCSLLALFTWFHSAFLSSHRFANTFRLHLALSGTNTDWRFFGGKAAAGILVWL